MGTIGENVRIAATRQSLPFPQSLAEKYQPKALADFCGLKAPRRILQKFVAAPYQSAWLFVGEPGIGKTTMALAMAAEGGFELWHVASKGCDLAAVEEVCCHCHYVPMNGKGFHLVLVDEADEMSNAAYLAFLSRLDATAFPPKTVFVFTANRIGDLEPRFLSRCRQLRFAKPDAYEIADFLANVAAQEANGKSELVNVEGIALTCGGNVRDALMQLEVALMEL